MSKITFRADEDLVERVERLDASKSEVMREALRAYLDGHTSAQGRASARDDRTTRTDRGEQATLDELLADRVDAMLVERLGELGAGGSRDLDLTISLEGATGAAVRETTERGVSDEGAPRASDGGAATPSDGPGGPATDEPASDGRTCGQCGADLGADHVYCPNCGEKASRRVFCECGDELRSDWAFCPSCGRRTAAADVLDG